MDLLFASLSDLHLGEEDSLLTNLALDRQEIRRGAPSPCMNALVNYLHALKRGLNQGKPIPFLVLNGDIMELALAQYPPAVSTFRVFLGELAARRVCDRVVYVPGNHDHALWGLIRDSHFVDALGREREVPEDLELQHATRLSVPRSSSVLDAISSNLPVQAAPLPVLAGNPALRLQSRDGADFLFHHGHLMEDIYKMLSLLKDRLMSDLSLEELRRKPLRDDLWTLESENWSWIDFVWSGFARAGRVGRTVEALYELLGKPEGIRKLIGRVSEILRTEFDIPMVPEAFEDDVLRLVLSRALEKGGSGSRERSEPEREPFNKDVRDMLERFVAHYLRNELAFEGRRPAKDRTGFVFGHTHKPFLQELQEGNSGFGSLSAANSGGWVVESEDYRSSYGPGIVLGSNAGDLALVTYRLDSEPGSSVERRGSWDVTLEKVREHDELAEAVAQAVQVRRKHLGRRAEKTGRILKNLEK